MNTGAKIFFGTLAVGVVYAINRMPSIKLISEGNNTMKVKFSIDGITKEIEFSATGGLQSFADANGYVFIANPMPEDNGMSFHIGIDFNPTDGTYKIAKSKFFEFIETSIAGANKLTYEILQQVPVRVFGFRETQTLHQFEKIKKLQPGLYEVIGKNSSFQITYGHKNIPDFTITG